VQNIKSNFELAASVKFKLTAKIKSKLKSLISNPNATTNCISSSAVELQSSKQTIAYFQPQTKSKTFSSSLNSSNTSYPALKCTTDSVSLCLVVDCFDLQQFPIFRMEAKEQEPQEVTVRCSIDELLSCQISSWYPQFRKDTIKTELVALSAAFVAFLEEVHS